MIDLFFCDPFHALLTTIGPVTAKKYTKLKVEKIHTNDPKIEIKTYIS